MEFEYRHFVSQKLLIVPPVGMEQVPTLFAIDSAQGVDGEFIDDSPDWPS